jgi:hypothetical protein
MRKAGQEIPEEFEDLFEVGFVQFEGAVEGFSVVFIEVKVESIEVSNAAIHTFDHLILELKKSRVVKRNPDMTGESRSCVVTHGPKTKLEFVRLRKDRVDEYRFLGLNV